MTLDQKESAPEEKTGAQAEAGASSPTGKPPVIEFRNIVKRFGTFVAISGLNLSIDEGEFFSLLGPSGCGKTTLLRMLAGFEMPTEGQVLLDGVDIAGLPAHRRPVNMMFQSYALFPHLNVEKNIGFGLKQDGMPSRAVSERVAEMLSLVQLEAFAKRKPHQLSGGQKARVALARALAKKPRVLLLDEPLSALDRKLRETMQLELTDLQDRLGTTFIIVTHDKEEAMTVSSRIAVMREGEIAQVAPPFDIYEQPNSRYVAEFIGDINILTGEADQTSTQGLQEILISQGARQIRLGSAVGDKEASGACQIGVRPEKIEVEPWYQDAVEGIGLEAGKVTNYLIGAVDDVAYLGDLSIYHVRIGEDQIVRASMINCGRKTLRLAEGDQVVLSWYAEDGMILRDSA